MEEVISKSDGQFKNILDDLVDYKKHASKKDPLIKELSRPNNSSSPISGPNPTPALSSKPAASLNSSIYSSAASSSSTSSSSDSSVSSSSSTTSSASSSPSQSQVVVASNTAQHNDVQDTYGKLEVAKMEDLRKKAKILEHHRVMPAALNAAATVSTCNTNSAIRVDEATKPCRPTLSLATSRVDYEPLASLGLLSGQQTASSGAPAISPNGLSGASSWKTIIAKRDKRRKKPVEKTILAKEIPGNRGDQSVEELAKFIKSRTSGAPNSGSNNKSIKIKSQNNPSSASNPSDIHNNNTYCNNSAFTNNDSAKKNESQMTSNNNVGSSGPCKSIQVSSKMNNHIQPRSQPQTKQNQNQTQQSTAQANASKTSHMPPKQPNQGDHNRENHHPKGNSSKPSQPMVNQLSKNSVNSTHKQIQSHQPRRVPQHVSQQPQAQPPQPQTQPPSPPQPQLDQQQSKPVKPRPVSQPNAKAQPAAVTFAHHIRVRDEDVRQYTFGFFDEPSNQTHPTAKPTNNSHAIINSRPQSLQEEPKTTKLKQPKTSPNSEEALVESKKEMSTKNINYEQIYKFIRDAWETVAARASPELHNH